MTSEEPAKKPRRQPLAHTVEENEIVRKHGTWTPADIRNEFMPYRSLRSVQHLYHKVHGQGFRENNRKFKGEKREPKPEPGIKEFLHFSAVWPMKT